MSEQPLLSLGTSRVSTRRIGTLTVYRIEDDRHRSIELDDLDALRVALAIIGDRPRPAPLAHFVRRDDR